MEAAIEAERRRDTETLQRQIKELDAPRRHPRAEAIPSAGQLKEKDD